MRLFFPACVLASAAVFVWPLSARAVDVGEVKQKLVRLDVTDSSVLAQQFLPRTTEGQKQNDHGYGMWLNRLNLALRWGDWTAGARLDSSLYWQRPIDREGADPDDLSLVRDAASRYRNAIYPAKLWVTYASPGLEVTAGDAYVQFGRGLVLSMRKVDDLGIDTTVRGAKVQIQKDPFAVTAVAGIANPSRVDEQTGRALFLPTETRLDSRGATPVFGSDRLIGVQLQAGRGLPLTLSTHAVRFTRCAPYRYNDQGRVIEGFFDAPLGSCAPSDTAQFLSTLPAAVSPTLTASEVDMAGQSIEIPSLFGHGKLYVEAAFQRRHFEDSRKEGNASGNALYGALTVTTGPIINTLEVKSYRNFYPVAASVDTTRASALTGITYSVPPTAEVITQDSMFNNFNACVDGGRLRTDWRLRNGLVLYGQAIYAFTKSEVPGGDCDRVGRTIAGTSSAADVQATVWDGLAGIEHLFDKNRSQFFFSTGVRNNERENGDYIYREASVRYTVTKWIKGPYSIEFTGWHRRRREESRNLRAPSYEPEWWIQGEHYTALKIAPKWVISQGIEYTTQLGFPTYYFNGAAIYRFTSESNVRLFVGQQRGGLRCISGICRFFPAFEGARIDLTLRF